MPSTLFNVPNINRVSVKVGLCVWEGEKERESCDSVANV